MFIVEYHNAGHEVIGYLRMPPRSSRRREFVTADIKQAARLPMAKALDAAGRYNSLHRSEGRTAHVRTAPANVDPFRQYMVRHGVARGTGDDDHAPT